MRVLGHFSALAVAALSLACGDAGKNAGSAGQAGMGGAGGASGSAGQAGQAGQAGAAGPPGVYAIESWDQPLPAPALGAFDAIVGEARVVALGESVHTSGGYSEAKSRLVRHLIESRGFRVLALETPRTDALVVDAFVQSCQGSVADAMKGMFWVFADEHLAGLLEWMCQWNQSHPTDRVALIGFDVQQPWHDGPKLASFLGGLSIPGAAELAPAISSCDGVEAQSSDAYYAGGGFEQTITGDQYAACSDATQAVTDFFALHASALEAEVGSREIRLAQLSLLGISAWENAKYWLKIDPTAAYQARDSAMATVLLELLELDHPAKDAVVWAHNFHIRQQSQLSVSYPPDVECTGTRLRQALGADYVAFGFLSTLTATNWPGQSCGALPKPGPSDLESLLDGVGPASLMVDLHEPALDVIPAGQSYGFGLNAGGEHAVPAEQYQGLVWRRESPKMQSIFGPTVCD